MPQQHFQVGQISKLRRNGPRQIAVSEDQFLEFCEVAQLRWNRAAQLIRGQRKERLQIAQVAQLWRDVAAQLIGRK